MRAGDAELNEDVLGVVVEFVGMVDAMAVRATCKELRDVAARVAWGDQEATVRVSGLSRWRACYPRARTARIDNASASDLASVRRLAKLGRIDVTSLDDQQLQEYGNSVTLGMQLSARGSEMGYRGERLVGHVTTLTLPSNSGVLDYHLVHLGHVTTLDLTGTEITDEGLRNIRQDVVSLCLRNSLLSDASLVHMGHVQNLDLRYCDHIADEGLRHLCSVTDLNITQCDLVTDEGLRHLGHVLTQNLSFCRLITDEGLKHLKCVTTLDLSHCSEITDEGLRHIGRVTTLTLSDCHRITDEGLKHLQSIRKLTLRDVAAVTGQQGICDVVIV